MHWKDERERVKQMWNEKNEIPGKSLHYSCNFSVHLKLCINHKVKKFSYNLKINTSTVVNNWTKWWINNIITDFIKFNKNIEKYALCICNNKWDSPKRVEKLVGLHKLQLL